MILSLVKWILYLHCNTPFEDYLAKSILNQLTFFYSVSCIELILLMFFCMDYRIQIVNNFTSFLIIALSLTCFRFLLFWVFRDQLLDEDNEPE